MIFTEEPRYEFYPNVGGNLSLPEAERFAVDIIRPTGYMRSDFTSLETKREFYPDDQPVDKDGKTQEVKKFKSISANIRYNAEYILCNCVGSVKNCEVRKGDKTVKIETGRGLADCRAYGIAAYIDAICAEVVSDKMTDAKKKNFA